ncbi:cytochrome P450 3A29-like isoform X2 [Haemaphysalis longicornis]
MNQAVGITIAVITVLCGVIVDFVLRRRRQFQLFKNMGIPGPEPDLIWGNKRQERRGPIKVMNEWRKQYGTKFGVYYGGEPFLVILDPEMAHECFVKKSAIFQDRVAGLVDSEPFKSSLFLLHGSEYKRVRAALKRVLTQKNIKALSTPGNLCASRFVEGLANESRSNGYAEVFRHATAFSMEFMAKALLSWKVGCQDDLHDRTLKGMIHVTDDLEDSAMDVAFAFPALRHLLNWIYPFTKYATVFDDFMKQVRNTIQSRRSGECPKDVDLLQILLDEQTSALKNHLKTASDRERYLDDQYITSNVVILLFAGYEAMSSALSFLTYLLAKHPSEQNEILEEIEHRFPNRGAQQLSYDELRQLKRLDMVVKEGLRLYPPVPVVVTRHCSEDTTACGQFLPAGLNVLASSWLIHRDPDLWLNPEKFVPERFEAGNGERYHPGSYFPFGLGARACIGRELGPLIVKCVLVQLLQTCRLELLDSTPVEAVPRALSLVPKNGIKIRVDRRLTRETS